MKTNAFWLLAALLCSCSSVVIQKAQLQTIHSAGVLSWYAAQRVPEVRGQGVLRKLDGDLRLQIAEDGLAAYLDAFESLGWEMAPADEIVNREAYKRDFLHRASKLPPGQFASAFRRLYFTATDMLPLWVESEDPLPAHPTRKIVRSLQDDLAEFVREIRLDAALLVRMQYCFRTFERDGKERVLATATSDLQIIDKKGKLLYATDTTEGCGGKKRGESTASMEIHGEDWMYDPMKRDEFRTLFREASRAEAVRLVDSIPVTPTRSR